MANRKAILVRLCKTEKGWRRYPAVLAKNGRPKPGWVRVGGEEKHYPEGRYQIRYYEGAAMRYRDVGDQPGDAMAARQQQANLLIARQSADLAGVKIEEPEQRRNLRREAERFIQAATDRGSNEAAEVYRWATDEFLEVTGRRFVDEVVSDDISAYQRALRERGCSDRTIFNRHRNLMSFLRFCGLDTKKLAPTSPKYEKTIPETYQPEELQQLFASIESEQNRTVDRVTQGLMFEILLKCGLREQELMYLEWPSVNLKSGILRVENNPRFGFKVKDCEQRTVPIPADLLEKLRAYRAAHPKRRMVVGTKNDRPNTKMLFTLKNRARRAGLNCGHCEECRERKECARWFLHKFRATYITTLIRSGMDLRTIMKLSGHSDLASVMRYLSPAHDEVVKQHVNQVSWM